MRSLYAVLILLPLSVTLPAVADCDTAASCGQQAANQFDELWGDPDEFVQDWKDTIKPMVDQYMGVAVAVAGFGLTVRALIK